MKNNPLANGYTFDILLKVFYPGIFQSDKIPAGAMMKVTTKR